MRLLLPSQYGKTWGQEPSQFTTMSRQNNWQVSHRNPGPSPRSHGGHLTVKSPFGCNCQVTYQVICDLICQVDQMSHMCDISLMPPQLQVVCTCSLCSQLSFIDLENQIVYGNLVLRSTQSWHVCKDEDYKQVGEIDDHQPVNPTTIPQVCPLLFCLQIYVLNYLHSFLASGYRAHDSGYYRSDLVWDDLITL